MAEFLSFIIFWQDLVVGKVYKNSDGKFKYFPNYDNIIVANEKLNMPKAFLINPQVTWGELPVLINDRIKLDPGMKNDCRLATDLLSIKKVN